MKRVKFLTKGRRAVHGRPREPQFYHQVGDEKDLDDETARAAVGAGAAEYIDAPELEADEAGDDKEAQAGAAEPKKSTLLSTWFGGGSDAPAPPAPPAPELTPELAPELAPSTPELEQEDDAEAGAETPPALE